jgi:hypothetical protein
MIKVYPTEVEASEDGCKIFTISLNEPDLYTIELFATTSKGNLELLLDSIRQAVKILEIEK